MTEVERIIGKGRISGDFLKPETRCGYHVDEKMKKVWAVELDLLMELDKVCRENGLKYFMAGGSLIGTIRHSGFIPWDDDIDVFMLREDYEKLLSISDKVFKEPYFLQTPYTDKGSYFSFAKLRNSNTTAISYPFRYCDFNQGIFLDIFVMDDCELDAVKEHYERINELILDNSTYMRSSVPDPTEEEKLRIASHSGRDPMDVYEEIERLAKYQYGKNAEYVNLMVNTVAKYNENINPKIWFDKCIYKSFEGFDAPVPESYDEILSRRYGDYMKFTPPEQRGHEHTTLVFEPDVPYKEYIKTLR